MAQHNLHCMVPTGHRPLAWVLTLAAVGLLLLLPGCGGCRPSASNQNNETEEEEKEKEKEKPKPDFEFAYKEDDRVVGMQVLPGDLTNGVKPGHWMGMTQPMKANNFDFAGELRSAAVESNTSRRPVMLERTPFRLQASRPVALPKGQLKHVQMQVFVPRRNGQGGRRANLLAELRARGTGRTELDDFHPTTTMDAHQYYLVALARRPASYNYLKVIDSVKAPKVGDFVSSSLLHYRVVLPTVEQNVALPTNPLLWTSIAYVIWDDVDPEALTLDQQDALVDWLHWGGCLIVSGPGSLSTLKDSFLGNYLPALPGETEKLPQERFDELNAHFTLPGDKGTLFPLTVVDEKPPEGVQLKLRKEGAYVPKTGELLAERQVGTGRIVVSSFALSHPQLISWRNFDGFFNACLLRRPARKFHGNRNAEAVGVRFHRTTEREGRNRIRRNEDNAADTYQPASDLDMEKDPRFTSGVRYFTRDAGLMRANVQDAASAAPMFDRGHVSSIQSGVGGWNDFSGVSNAARNSLKAAAGITVPERGFVLRVLAVYLLVLVPANWAIFKVIGRVEWAWAAAPLIAIGGAFWVIQAAQLDIGFARSRTEVAVLELQADHPRGHLTRYMALYTSLSTSYDVTFDDKNALAQPFSTDPQFEMVSGQTANTVTFRRDNKASLRGFQIASNSTSMLHSEEQRNFGGSLELQEQPSGLVVVNKSKLSLKDVGVVRRLDENNESPIRVAWIGELPAGESVTLSFGPATDNVALLSQWQQSSTTSSEPPPHEVSLAPVLEIARDPRLLLPGDMKLIGWTDEDLGGIELSPSPRQQLTKTLVVANLSYQPLAPPTPDINTRDAVDPKKNVTAILNHSSVADSGVR